MKEEVPTITIDMDKECPKCGNKGVAPNGLCLQCSLDRIVEGKPRINTKMMLNKKNFAIANLAPEPPKGAESKMSCILVCPDKTAVTDGHMLLEVSGQQCDVNFLPFEDLDPKTDFEPFSMPSDEALALAKLFVKAPGPDGNIVAVQPENGAGVAAFALRQETKEKIFRMDRPKGGFPDYDNLFYREQEEIAYVTVNANMLIRLLKHLMDVSGCAVRIGIYGTDKPIRFDAIDEQTKQSARAVLMPMKE